MKPILYNFPMPIRTPRLILRPPQVGDGAVVNSAVVESLDFLAEFMPWARVKPSVEDSEEFVRQSAANWILKSNQEPYLPLFIFDKNNQEFIGATGYHHFDWEVPCIETGYWLRTSRLKCGSMTEAVNAIIQYAFKQLGMKRVSITCDVSNERSRKIPERLHYSLEGQLKCNRKNLKSGELSHTLIYAKYDLSGLPSLTVEW